MVVLPLSLPGLSAIACSLTSQPLPRAYSLVCNRSVKNGSLIRSLLGSQTSVVPHFPQSKGQSFKLVPNVLQVLIALQPHCLLYPCSLSLFQERNEQERHLPQGLCSCCCLYLEHSFLGYHTARSLVNLRSLFKCLPSRWNLPWSLCLKLQPSFPCLSSLLLLHSTYLAHYISPQLCN